MKYISTRGQTEQMDFCEVLLRGIAPDGGLMMPKEYPKIDKLTLDQWRHLSYTELTFQIMRLYIDDIPEEDLRYLIDSTYTKDAFGSEEITPLKELKSGLCLLGLSNGPTMAFKDIAMQFLGKTFEYVLTKENKYLNILGATSGDTGSAAEYAMMGRNGIQVFMLSPEGKMSPFQTAQMYTIDKPNIFNIAVKGRFDDCQDIVKKLSGEETFKREYRIGNINSINWGRVLAQIVYYFKGYFAATKSNNETVSFAVPSGNFGDVCAGHVARMMGLPIDRLMVCTNENDVLDEFFQSGEYRPRPSNNVRQTSSPSMDIAKASNIERFIFDVLYRDPTDVTALWNQVDSGKGFSLAGKIEKIRDRYGFTSGKTTHQQRLQAIREIFEEDGIVIDPHTAAGVAVAKEIRRKDEKVICLETALATKFADTVKEALGDAKYTLPREEEWKEVVKKEQHYTVIPNDVNAVRMFIRDTLEEQKKSED